MLPFKCVGVYGVKNYQGNRYNLAKNLKSGILNFFLKLSFTSLKVLIKEFWKEISKILFKTTF